MSVISSPSNKRRKLIDNDIRNEEEVHVVEAGRAAGYSSPRIGATDEEEQEDVKSNCAVILHRGADGELQVAIPNANFGGDSSGDLCNAGWTYADDEEKEFEDGESEKETKVAKDDLFISMFICLVLSSPFFYEKQSEI